MTNSKADTISQSLPPSYRETEEVSISLLTCSPGKQEVYTLFGHTAIRLQDPYNDIDVVVNYGLFNPHTPNFIFNFILGKTDYYAGATSYQLFVDAYTHEGRDVHQQVLNLTPEEKQDIIKTLYNNLTPQNNTYRYNIFYKNCTTLAKDAIWNNLKEKIQFKQTSSNNTIRSLINQYTQSSPWLQFGINLILGYKADKKLTVEQQLFLPIQLMNAMQDATRNKRPLVTQHTIITPQNNSQGKKRNHIYQLSIINYLFIALFIIIAIITIAYRHKKQTSILPRIIDTLLILITTAAAIILIILALSQHPTTTANLLILMINPIPTTILWHTIRGRENTFTKRIWTLWGTTTIACLAGSVIQTYPIPVFFIAAIIITRAIAHLTNNNNLTETIVK